MCILRYAAKMIFSLCVIISTCGDVCATATISVVESLSAEGIDGSWLVNRHSFYGPATHDLCLTISIKGPMSTGDSKRFKDVYEGALARLPPEYRDNLSGRCGADFEFHFLREHPRAYNILVLAGRGGNFDEALQISTLASIYGFITVVGPNSECLSACAIVFMGGAHKWNAWHHAVIAIRWMHVSATVGFHSPFLSAKGIGFTDENMRKTYVAGTRDSASFGRILQHDVLDKSLYTKVLLNTTADRFITIDTVEDAIRWNVNVFGYQKRDEISDYDRIYGCANMWNWYFKKIPGEYEEANYLVFDNKSIDEGRNWENDPHTFMEIDLRKLTNDGLSPYSLRIGLRGGRLFSVQVECVVNQVKSLDTYAHSLNSLSARGETKLIEINHPPESYAVDQIAEWVFNPGTAKLKELAR